MICRGSFDHNSLDEFVSPPLEQSTPVATLVELMKYRIDLICIIEWLEDRSYDLSYEIHHPFDSNDWTYHSRITAEREQCQSVLKEAYEARNDGLEGKIIQ